jgi:hypothetical protein
MMEQSFAGRFVLGGWFFFVGFVFFGSCLCFVFWCWLVLVVLIGIDCVGWY